MTSTTTRPTTPSETAAPIPSSSGQQQHSHSSSSSLAIRVAINSTVNEPTPPIPPPTTTTTSTLSNPTISNTTTATATTTSTANTPLSVEATVARSFPQSGAVAHALCAATSHRNNNTTAGGVVRVAGERPAPTPLTNAFAVECAQITAEMRNIVAAACAAVDGQAMPCAIVADSTAAAAAAADVDDALAVAVAESDVAAEPPLYNTNCSNNNTICYAATDVRADVDASRPTTTAFSAHTHTGSPTTTDSNASHTTTTTTAATAAAAAGSTNDDARPTAAAGIGVDAQRRVSNCASASTADSIGNSIERQRQPHQQPFSIAAEVAGDTSHRYALVCFKVFAPPRARVLSHVLRILCVSCGRVFIVGLLCACFAFRAFSTSCSYGQ